MEALSDQGNSVVTAVIERHRNILRERTVEAQNRIAQLERELAAAKERADTATSEDELNAARTEIAALREALDNARNEAERRCNEQLGLVQRAILERMPEAADVRAERVIPAAEAAGVRPEDGSNWPDNDPFAPDGTSGGGKKKRKTGKRSKKSVRKSKKRRHGRK